jgi:predicted metalloendopeptidase
MHRLVVFLVVAACSSGSKPPETTLKPAPPPPSPTVDAAPAKMTLAQSGIVPEWMDTSADACSDFFAFACGNFVKTAQIPGDRSSWGAIELVTKDNEDFLHKVLDDAAATQSSDPVTAKLGKYYAACMDESAIESAGIAPIQPMLDEIAKVKDGATAAHAVIALEANALTPFFSLAPQQDFADASKMIAALDQSGLGLPDRKYYLDSKGSMPKTRKAYTAHMERMFALLGASDPKAAAADALRIETTLAKLQQDEVVRRDPHAIYHRIDRDGLQRAAQTFPWGDYLAALGIPSVTAITVNSPPYYTAVAKMIANEPAASLRNYLTWTVLRQTANWLGKAWVDEAFTLQKELQGVKELPPRWRRCVRRVDQDLGELLGQSYVKARFVGDAKARAVDLTKTILDAMRVELDNLPWMDDPTRRAAKMKLDRMAYLVGFPDTWRKYEFEISRSEFAKNVHAATRFASSRASSRRSAARSIASTGT